jgi:hypothetical protein
VSRADARESNTCQPSEIIAQQEREAAEQKARRRQKRSHKGPNTKVGHNNKPPLRAKRSVKNSHTSPKQIARRRKIDEALSFREAGHSYVKIARHMKASVSTVHGWVVQGMNMIPINSAKEVLALELQRLDNLMSAHYAHAVNGDVSATEMCLRVIEKRARLCGLFPREGQVAQILVAAADRDVQPLVQVEFVVPTGKHEEEDAPASPPGAQPPFPWQRALPPPQEMERDALGTWRPKGFRTE